VRRVSHGLTPTRPQFLEVVDGEVEPPGPETSPESAQREEDPPGSGRPAELPTPEARIHGNDAVEIAIPDLDRLRATLHHRR
jgi:hypothetical protein